MDKHSVLRNNQYGFVKLHTTPLAWWGLMENPPEISEGTSFIQHVHQIAGKGCEWENLDAPGFWAESAGLVPLVSKKDMLDAENGKKRAIKMTAEMEKLLSRTLKKAEGF